MVISSHRYDFDFLCNAKGCTNEKQAAESQMSLGNVTASPGDERYFFQAIRYLRQAAAIPGYRLSVYHQQYLNDYGRYVV